MKPNTPLNWKYFKEVLANFTAAIHVGQSTGLSNRTHHRQDYQKESGEGTGWGALETGFVDKRDILPVADSSGANSSTKDRQNGGQPCSLSVLL